MLLPVVKLRSIGHISLLAGALLAGALGLVAFAAACGGADPTATPAPTATTPPPTNTPAPTPVPAATTPPPTNTPAPTPAPTATTPPPTTAPEPTAAPTATTPPPTAAPEVTAAPEPTAVPEAANSLMDFRITRATTGQDLMDRLTEFESACIEDAVGSGVYQILLAMPLMMAGSDTSAAAPLFHCLTVENAVLLGIVFLDAQAGGWAEESRSCITEVGLVHPDAIFIRLGVQLGSQPIDAAMTLAHNVQIYECLNDEEKKAFTVTLWTGLDDHAGATGSDIVALLSDSEAACVRDNLSDEQFATMVAARPLHAVSIGATVSHCIDPETNIKIFANGIQWAMGGVTEETLSCLEEFGRNNPAFVALMSLGLEGIQAVPAAEFLEIIAVGNQQYACMTPDELLRVQQAATVAMQ